MLFGLTTYLNEATIQPDELARFAEARGFESLWLPDHSTEPGAVATNYDPFVALSVAASATQRLRLGTGVCFATERDALITAKEVASLDRLSGGRFSFGVGGRNPADDDEPKRLREHLLALRVLWTEDEPAFAGEFVRFEPAWSYPKPLQQPHPPLLIAANDESGARLAVEVSAGVIVTLTSTDALASLLRRVQALRRESLAVTVFTSVIDADVVATLAYASVERTVFEIPTGAREATLSTIGVAARLMG